MLTKRRLMLTGYYNDPCITLRVLVEVNITDARGNAGSREKARYSRNVDFIYCKQISFS